MTDMKEIIKSVSIDLFHRQGYFATSINDIASGSGIRKASIYYHYPSKEALLYQIFVSTMDDLTAYLRSRLEGIIGIENKMRAAIRSHVIFHLERQKENFIANSELRGLAKSHYEIILGKRDKYELIFQNLIRKGIDRGVFANEDVKILSYALLTLCTTGAFWYKPGGRLSIGNIAEIYENFIIKGLKKLTIQSINSNF